MKALLIFILLLLFTNGFAQTNKIIGKWAAFHWSEKDKSNSTPGGTVEFKKDLSIVMYQGSDKLPTGTYKLNTTKNPHWVDISMLDESNKKVTVMGLIEFIDSNTAKFELFQGLTEHPTQFNDVTYGSIELISVLRRLSATGEVIVDEAAVDPDKYIITKKWNVYPWDKRFDNMHKSSTSWELTTNYEFIQEGSALWQANFTGSFELNTTVQPYWIDLKISGKKVFGLFEMLGPNEMKIEFFPNHLSDEHPVQFSDVTHGADVYGVDRNIFYLK